jgi:hypothetical protein
MQNPHSLNSILLFQYVEDEGTFPEIYFIFRHMRLLDNNELRTPKIFCMRDQPYVYWTDVTQWDPMLLGNPPISNLKKIRVFMPHEAVRLVLSGGVKNRRLKFFKLNK